MKQDEKVEGTLVSLRALQAKRDELLDQLDRQLAFARRHGVAAEDIRSIRIIGHHLPERNRRSVITLADGSETTVKGDSHEELGGGLGEGGDGSYDTPAIASTTKDWGEDWPDTIVFTLTDTQVIQDMIASSTAGGMLIRFETEDQEGAYVSEVVCGGDGKIVEGEPSYEGGGPILTIGFTPSHPLIMNIPFIDGTVSLDYSQTAQAEGGAAPYVWSKTLGVLPDGLSLNSSTGEISGIPTTPGGEDFDLTVTDNDLDTDTRTFHIEIVPLNMGAEPAGHLSFNANAGQSYAVHWKPSMTDNWDTATPPVAGIDDEMSWNDVGDAPGRANPADPSVDERYYRLKIGE